MTDRRLAGVISNVSLLDLTPLSSAEELAAITRISDDVLVVAGQLVVTGPVATVGFRRVVVAGQVVAPRDSQAVLGPAITVKGQLA